MLKRLKKVLKPRRTDDGAKIIVNCEKLEQRVALLEEGILEEYTVERTDEVNIVGSIYKGVVRNIEPGLKAMFVDIGLEKNAFLHFWDAIPEALDSGLEEIQRGNRDGDGKGKGGRRKKPKRITAADIPNLYPVGSEVLVQVTKGPIGTKGPRITTNISLAGRFMVLMPRNEQFGISRKVDDPKERSRLRRVMEKLRLPEGMGIILRTVSVGQRLRFFRSRPEHAARSVGRHRTQGSREQGTGVCFPGARSHRAHGARLPHRRNFRGAVRRHGCRESDEGPRWA